MKTKNYNYYLLALISTFRVRLSSSIRKLTTPGLFFLISNLILIPQITYSNDTLQMLYPKIYSNSPVNEGDSIILIVSNTGILPIVWTGPNGFSSSLVYNVIINVDSNATGTYYCNIIDTINDTTYFISTLIKVKSKPLHHIITITTYDTNICENASIELTATSGFGPYDWYDDLNNYYGQTAGNTITIGQVLQSTTFIVYCGPNGSLSGQISIVAFDCCADLGENILLLDNKNCLTAPVNLPPKIAINGFFLYNIDNYSFPNVSEIVMRDNSLIFGTGRDVNIHDLYIHGCNHIWNGIQFDNLNCTGLKLIQMKNCTLENMEGGFSVSSFSAISPTSI